MWPQKWYASASPGATTALTTEPPVAPSSAVPTRASRPRRDVPSASSSVAEGRSASGTGRLRDAALGRGEHGLELRDRVERPLREDAPAGVEGERVRAAGNP